MAGEFQAIDLTPGERAQLAEFTSVQYGFLKLDDDGSAKKKLIEKDAKDDEMDTGDADKGSKENKDTKVAKETKDADKTKKRRLLEHWVYCRLGHLHLLLEQFPKALSSYQKFYVLEKNHWRDLMFLYGLGMVYFHFNNYRW
ncbi:hypothetical protein BaRGS_00019395 [Batillaria attramentaria]|uniref:Uncharacterized protein n=1 Tax=Batillaria attramentaria TaxID=370345 RepID=A0ABD0KQ01_9CAEN